ncbi:MAG: alpha/beta fold hydrolase [Chloroflexia bacterium]|nr:alpha/beta fold hydrolase [Chloroflexia bacterium]
MAAKRSRVLFPQRSWRFYRNWLIFMTTWLLLALAVWLSLQVHWAIILIWALPAYLLCSSIFCAYRWAHPMFYLPPPRISPALLGINAERVEFPSRDGLVLFGWFLPGRTRSAIILVHGLGGAAMDMISQAMALAKCGYHIFLFDLRAHGSSDGDTCSGGWNEAQDLLGAVDYLQGRQDVDPDKIAVLGVSLGGRVAIRGAALCPDIRAVIAEGLGPMALSDHKPPTTLWRRWVVFPLNRLAYALDTFMNGVRPSRGLLAHVREIAPRPLLLVTTGKGAEQAFGRMAFEAAGEPRDLLELPQARHAGAFFKQPELYLEKVRATLGAAGLMAEPVGEELPEQGLANQAA